MYRALISAALVVGLALAAGACAEDDGGSGGGGGGSFTVGALPDLSGPLVVQGTAWNAGLKAYFDALNKRGGIDGKKVELVSRDSRSDVQTSRTLYQELAGQGAVTVIAPDLSQVYGVLAGLAPREKVGLISPGAIPDQVEPGQPYLYLSGIPLEYEANIALDFLKDYGSENDISSPGVAAISIETVSTEGWRKQVQREVPARLGGKLVADETVDPAAADVGTQASSVARANPDYVLLRLLGSQAAPAVKALRRQGFDGPIIADYAAADEVIFKEVSDPEYYAVRQWADPSDKSAAGTAKLNEAAQAAGVKSDANSPWFTYGYAMGQTIETALKECGAECTSERFDEAMNELTLETDGLSGPLEVSGEEHRLVESGRLYRWNEDSGTSKAVTDWVDGS